MFEMWNVTTVIAGSCCSHLTGLVHLLTINDIVCIYLYAGMLMSMQSTSDSYT